MRKLIWMACFAYLLTGFGHIIIGSVLEPMIRHYELSYSDGGQLIMNQFLGFLVGVLLAPFIVKRIGRRAILLLALSLFAVSQLALFFLIPWEILLIIIPFGGAGFGMIETVLAGMIIGKLKEKKASIMVLTEVFFGVGALVIPALAAFFIARGEWNMIFVVVSLIVFTCLLLWMFLRFDEYEPLFKKELVDKDAPAPIKLSYPKVTWPLIVLGSFFFFLYVGVEMTFPNYLPSILSMTSDLTPAILAISITVFWGAMTIGRFIMFFTIERIGISRLFVITVIGQLVTLGLFAASPHYIISFIVIFFAGLLMGGIFSLGLLVLNEGIPGLEDRTTSLLIAMGGLGGAFLPRLTGSLLDQYPVEVTLWTLFGFSVIMAILMLLIFGFRKRLIEKGEQDEI
ncbi:MFS transporter [Alkalicoccobacillus murimartini]|uniref:FHS family glucose/mannose:H+ symporter-like MFS transporter n=1 Tax=Alkalicoccobacillus murimartini TaxID=171685 RepID=A0ABT9YI83_9BACI|nr:MFS transporter [Alkalicoccobacillus murimartini]MDQ0207313.1 FHS family glucose/mannose:H+ symporter-like MFS transporter [Alkalicoccobacillus murimartini]